MKLIDVVLSTCIGVDSCVWFISIRILRIVFTSWPFSKTDAISHSEAVANMFFSILHSA